MSELIVVAYPDVHRAAEVMVTLRRLQAEYLVDLEDAVYVTKETDGKVKLHQALNLTTTGAVEGTFWGVLIGLLFLNPLLGGLLGAGAGALTGSVSDYGINDDFIRELGGRLAPNSSAIFILLRKITADRVVPELGKFGGHILQTSLSQEAESKLQAALDGIPVTEPIIPESPQATL
jgi:uncharacterized membrane protein